MSSSESNPVYSPDLRSENEKIMSELRAVRQALRDQGRVLNDLIDRVQDLPSAYRKPESSVTAGETCQDLTKSQTIPATLMVERSLDVPYETAYPISKR
jgi:hypothetical protein